MNRKQAENTYQLLEMFRGIRQDKNRDFDLSEIASNEADENNVVADCPSTGCFCGWCPTLFKDFTPVIDDDGIEGKSWGYPEIPTGIDPDEYPDEYVQYYADFFGLPSFGLYQMIMNGDRPEGFDCNADEYYATDVDAVIAFMEHHLEEAGYKDEDFANMERKGFGNWLKTFLIGGKTDA